MVVLKHHCIILLLVSLFYLAQSTHFRGGILGWRPAEDNNKVVIFWQVAWRRSWDRLTTYCNSRGEMKNGEGELHCQECIPSHIHSPVEFQCTDYSEIYDWSTGVGELEYYYLQNTFTLQYAPDSVSYWVDLQNYGHSKYWKLVSTVNMTERADIGRPNSSPVTSMIPIIKVQQGCTSTINIPARDPDGDSVRCRWADGDKNECPQPTNGRSVCGPLSSNSFLDPDTCQITFNATGNPGWYAVSVIIEDFRESDPDEAISQIPLQFLINVFPLSDKCSKPRIIEPLGSCQILRPNELWEMSIRASNSRPAVDITQISTSTPPNVAKTFLAPYPGSDTEYNVTLSWTPTTRDIGQHFVCFFATDADGVSTDQQCVTLVVTDEQIEPPPSLLPLQSVPSSQTPISADTNEMIFVFDSQIKQPEVSNYVSISKFRANGVRRVIARYNTLRSDRVHFPTDDLTKFKINTTDLNLRSDRVYVVEVDTGVVVGRYSDPCSASKPNDGGMWYFATDAEPTTTVPPTTILTTTTLPTTTLPTTTLPTTTLQTTTLPTTTLPTTTLPMPTPEAIIAPLAECSSSGLRVFVPRLIVGDVEPSHLHFNDPNCRGSFGNASVIMMETRYDSCGTITRVKSTDLIKYRNTIFCEPLLITDTRITREREIQINIVCDVSSDGFIHAEFDPDTSPLIFNMRETASFNFALRMYHDDTFSEPYTVLDYPVPVQLRERLYFVARASNAGLHLAMDNCKATPQSDPSAEDYFYFILNGCAEDSTVQFHQSPSLSEVRFSVESFEFHRHGMLDTVKPIAIVVFFIGRFQFDYGYANVFISCDVNICSPHDVNSVCQQGCTGDHVVNDVQSDTGEPTRGDGPLRKRRSSKQLNAETEHSERIPLRYASSKDRSTSNAASPAGLFDITVLVVNVCLFVIVSVATIVGIKLAIKLSRFNQSNDAVENTAHVQTVCRSKSEMTFDNRSYEIDI